MESLEKVASADALVLLIEKLDPEILKDVLIDLANERIASSDEVLRTITHMAVIKMVSKSD